MRENEPARVKGGQVGTYQLPVGVSNVVPPPIFKSEE